MAELDDLVREFLVESFENLDRLDQDFVALEKDPGARDRLASIFRTIHTIKGTCGFLGFTKLESVTHIGENVLAKLRDGVMSVNTEIVTALLKMVDAVREILRSIESGAGEGNGDYTGVIAELTRLNANRSAPAAPASEPQSQPEPAPAPAPVASAEAQPPSTPTPAASEPEHHDEAEKPQPANTADARPADSGASSAANSGIRVDVGLLDRLMNLVGELVLARNQILQYSSGIDNATLSSSTQRLNLITTELQEGVMKTRMQPIGNVWSKFPRVVRDVAQTCGKRVRVEMEGKETELDKTIIEAIKDPLTHIIRNSVDHGVETPEKRKAAGKPEEGVLSLRAFHEGGQVNIEISDDGAGINVDRVKKKAIEKGLVTAEQAARMSDREAVNMIWLPGFSTAEKVTNVSGRGVGMDVVKTNIEKIGGSLDLQSKPGEGTTIRIKIPLTLAIIPALIITSGGERFAIPQVSLLELVRLEGKDASTRIESVQGAPVYRLRGKLLPITYLSNQLGLSAGAAGANSGASLDFSIARDRHKAWKQRLRDFLDGKTQITLEQAGTHHDCSLGKWIDADGGVQFGTIPEFQTLVSLHTELHETVRKVIELRTSGNAAAAEDAAKRVNALSDQIVALLDKLEHTATNTVANIVVLQADDRQFGLVVDEINDTEEIVVKPLSKVFKGLTTFAGATIMGDGRVALILDVMGLAHRANVISETKDHGVAEAQTEQNSTDAARQTMLVFQLGQHHRMAVPLASVARLEELPRSSVEYSGEQQVVQYRGQIMPLIPLARVLGESGPRLADENAEQSSNIQVIVHARGQQSVGLVVDRIVDIVDQAIEVQQANVRPGVLGSAVIDKKVTQLLDIEGVVGMTLLQHPAPPQDTPLAA